MQKLSLQMLNEEDSKDMSSNLCSCCRKHTEWAEDWFSCQFCGHKTRNKIIEINYAGQAIRNKDTEVLNRKTEDRVTYFKSHVGDFLSLETALELGCAEGAYLQALRESIPNLYTVGVEPSQDHQIASLSLDKVYSSFDEIDINVLNKFSLITMFHVLEHIDDINSVLARCSDLLIENGLLYLEVPHASGSQFILSDPNQEHIHSFTLLSIVKILENHNFKIKILSTGHFESPTYQDSIRVIARKRTVTPDLKSRIKKLIKGHYYIWGLGGDFSGYLQNYIELSSVTGLIDENIKTISIAGRDCSVIKPSDICNRVFEDSLIISSARYTKDIMAFMKINNIEFAEIISLEQLLGE
jgi:2-polyprenyl-3-methyl-5-hydroxy-6-metoxy-1,4-benzoquinol methylase